MKMVKWKILVEGEKFLLQGELGKRDIRFTFFHDLLIKQVKKAEFRVPDTPDREKMEFYKRKLLSLFFSSIRFNYENLDGVFKNLYPQFKKEFPKWQRELAKYFYVEEQLKKFLQHRLEENDDNLVAFMIVKRWGVTSMLNRKDGEQLDREEVRRILKFLRVVYRLGKEIKKRIKVEVVEIGEKFYFYAPVNNSMGILMVTNNTRLGIYIKSIEAIIAQFKEQYQILLEQKNREEAVKLIGNARRKSSPLKRRK